MLKKIYQELVVLRKEVRTIRECLQLKEQVANGKEPMEWRRFELITKSEAERERLESVIKAHNLSRQELAIILFGLRVRPEFGKEHFGI